MKCIFFVLILFLSCKKVAESPAKIYAHSTPSTLFSETFGSGYSNWTLTNTGLTHGLTFAVSGGSAVWTATHTATVAETVAGNNLVSNQTFSNDFVCLIFKLSWTDPNPTNAQHEAGIWWDSNNRIYYGNNSTDNLSFISIKVGGVNQIITSTFSQDNAAYVKIEMDRVNDIVSFYRWQSSTWVAITQLIDTSTFGIPSTNYSLFQACGAEINTRTGGDTGSVDFFYLYDNQTNINPTTL